MQLHEIINKLDCLAKQADNNYSEELGEEIISAFGEFMERYPSEFYEWFLETISRRDPLRIHCEQLLRNGLVTKKTTWPELRKLLGIATTASEELCN